MTFTTGGEIVTTYFNVTSTPVGIISVVPYHGPQSTTMNVEITGLNTHWVQGTTLVLFGPQITVNTVTVHSTTDLTVNITTSYMLNGVLTATPPGWQSIYVNTNAEMLISGFLVDAPFVNNPTILSVFPASAAQGSSTNVVITGQYTNWVQGQTEAILGAGVTVSNLTITSPTTATATIGVTPTAPVVGNSVFMITVSEYDSGANFTVTPSAALILSVGPAIPSRASKNCSPGIWQMPSNPPPKQPDRYFPKCPLKISGHFRNSVLIPQKSHMKTVKRGRPHAYSEESLLR